MLWALSSSSCRYAGLPASQGVSPNLTKVRVRDAMKVWSAQIPNWADNRGWREVSRLATDLAVEAVKVRHAVLWKGFSAITWTRTIMAPPFGLLFPLSFTGRRKGPHSYYVAKPEPAGRGGLGPAAVLHPLAGASRDG